jgi:hypothetical protein
VDEINDILIQENSGDLGNTDIIPIDFSDITKPYAESMENLDKVYDGSEKVTSNGYNIIISSRINGTEIKPLYTKLFSTREDGYKSMFTEVKDFLDKLKLNAKGKLKSTFVMDRAFDSQRYYNYFLAQKLNFLTRLKKNRKIILTENFKSRYVEELYRYARRRKCLGEVIHEGKLKKSKLEIGYITVRLEKTTEVDHIEISST